MKKGDRRGGHRKEVTGKGVAGKGTPVEERQGQGDRREGHGRGGDERGRDRKGSDKREITGDRREVTGDRTGVTGDMTGVRGQYPPYRGGAGVASSKENTRCILWDKGHRDPPCHQGRASFWGACSHTGAPPRAVRARFPRTPCREPLPSPTRARLSRDQAGPAPSCPRSQTRSWHRVCPSWSPARPGTAAVFLSRGIRTLFLAHAWEGGNRGDSVRRGHPGNTPGLAASRDRDTAGTPGAWGHRGGDTRRSPRGRELRQSLRQSQNMTRFFHRLPGGRGGAALLRTPPPPRCPPAPRQPPARSGGSPVNRVWPWPVARPQQAAPGRENAGGTMEAAAGSPRSRRPLSPPPTPCHPQCHPVLGVPAARPGCHRGATGSRSHVLAVTPGGVWGHTGGSRGARGCGGSPARGCGVRPRGGGGGSGSRLNPGGGGPGAPGLRGERGPSGAP